MSQAIVKRNGYRLRDRMAITMEDLEGNENYIKLRNLCIQLAEVEDDILRTDALQREKNSLRDQISNLVVLFDGPVNIPGFGTLRITSPGLSVKYDAKALDEVVDGLRKSGYNSIADAIVDCRIESPKTGSLMIRRVFSGRR